MIDSINNPEELAKADPDSVRYHRTFKGVPRMLLGIIDRLPFWNVHEDEYAKNLKGNALVFYQVIKTCIQEDKRTHRKKMVTKPSLFWCFLYAFDSDFREWFNRVIYLGIQRRDELVFPPHHLDPTCWTDDEGNRRVSGAEIPLSGVVYSDHTAVVLKEQLPPRKYWVTIEGTDRYFGIDSNRPIFTGNGWAYPLVLDYGTREQFDHNLLFGDPL